MKYLIYLPLPRSCNEAAQKRQLHFAIMAAVHYNPRTSNEPAKRTSNWKKDGRRKMKPF